MQGPASVTPSWFVRRDIDGFFGLAIDNIVQILLIVGFVRGCLGLGLTWFMAAFCPVWL